MARVSIEDCLTKVQNRFALVSIAAHRTRELMKGEDSLVRSKNREAVTALREIAEGHITEDRKEADEILNPKTEEPQTSETPSEAAE